MVRNSSGWVKEMAQEILDLRDLTRQRPATVIDGVTLAGGSLLALARADVAATLMVAPRDSNTHKFWVEVIKSRARNTSKHAFLTLDDAVEFMRQVVES